DEEEGDEEEKEEVGALPWRSALSAPFRQGRTISGLPKSCGLVRRVEHLVRSDGGCSSAGFAGAISGLLASDARGPARGRPAARISGWLASDGGAPAPRRPAARAACWGEVRKGGEAPLRV